MVELDNQFDFPVSSVVKVVVVSKNPSRSLKKCFAGVMCHSSARESRRAIASLVRHLYLYDALGFRGQRTKPRPPWIRF